MQPVNPCWEQRLKQLTERHSLEKIYRATAAVWGSRDLDLTLIKGELVAVVSERDSRGDRRRWLVDNGGRFKYLKCTGKVSGNIRFQFTETHHLKYLYKAHGNL